MDYRKKIVVIFYTYVLPLVFVMQFFLGALWVLDILDVNHYIMLHRVVNTIKFDLFFDPGVFLLALLLVYPVITENRRIDRLSLLLVSLATVPLMGFNFSVAVISVLVALQGLYIYRCYKFSLIYLLVISSTLNAVSIVHYLIYAASGYDGFLKDLVGLNNSICGLSSYISPFACIVFLYGWLIGPLFKRFKKGGFFESLSSSNLPDDRRSLFYLVLILVLNIFMASYPFLSTVNPRDKRIGTDYRGYLSRARLVEEDFGNVFGSSGGSRSFLSLLMYVIMKLFFFSPEMVVKIMPGILLPLLSISAYFLAYAAVENRSVAVWSAFFTSCGLQMTAGMHAYFLSNMLALSLAFFSIGFLFRTFRSNNFMHLMLSAFFGGLILFTHPWTFDHYIFIVALFLLESLYYYVFKNKHGVMLINSMIFLIMLLIVELLKGIIFRVSGSVSATRAVSSGIISPFNFIGEYHDVLRLYGASLSYGLFYILAILGCFYVYKSYFAERYLFYFTMITSLLFLLGDSVIKSRLIYNIPVGLFASVGLLLFINLSHVKPYDKYVKLFVIAGILAYDFNFLAYLA